MHHGSATEAESCRVAIQAAAALGDEHERDRIEDVRVEVRVPAAAQALGHATPEWAP